MLTAFTGAGLGWARTSQSHWQRWTAPPAGFGLAVLVHSNWNSLNEAIQRTASFELAVVVLVVPFAVLLVALLWLAWQRERQVLEHLTEVPTEFASKDVMCSNRARWHAQWRAWRQGGFDLWQKVYRLQRTLMEWAFLQWHISEGHAVDPEAAAATVERYRSTVESLVEQLTKPKLAT